MRKNDQAYLLAGAWDLIHRQTWFLGEYYAYARSFIVYWVLAAFLKIIGAQVSMSHQWLANVNFLNVVAYWGALGLLTARLKARKVLVAWLVVLTSPVFLTTSIYVNTSALSLVWFWLALGCLRFNSRAARLFFYILIFLSVASRADIVLLIPSLAWFLCEQKNLRDFLRWFFRLAIPCILAVLFGLAISSEAAQIGDYYFKPIICMAFIVFGMGASFLFWVINALPLLKLIFSNSNLSRMYYAVGLCAYLLPFLFYVPQMHTPRYLILSLQTILLMALFQRGRALLRLTGMMFGRQFGRFIAGLSVASLFIGANVSAPSSFQPTIWRPSLFPTADGLMPMGATLPFLLRLRLAENLPLDHHQAVWRGVLQSPMEVGGDGKIPVLKTKMIAFFQLKAAMLGVQVRQVLVENAKNEPFFYAEKRTFLESNRGAGTSEFDKLLDTIARPINSELGQESVLKFQSGDQLWSQEVRLLKNMFPRTEFKIIGIYGVDRCEVESCGSGYRRVIFSQGPFLLKHRGVSQLPDEMSTVEGVYDLNSGLWSADLGISGDRPIVLRASSPIYLATSVTMEWMMGAVR